MKTDEESFVILHQPSEAADEPKMFDPFSGGEAPRWPAAVWPRVIDSVHESPCDDAPELVLDD